MAPPKGFIPWNKGKTNVYSKEVLESNRQKHLGKKLSKEHKLKIGLAMSKRKLSAEHKRKIGLNTTKCLTGKTYEELSGVAKSKERKEKISKNNWTKKMKGKFPQSTLQKKRENMKGSKNPMYGIRGPAHPSWLGGKKFEPYDYKFNNYFKDKIRLRDAYQCLKCGMRNEDHLILFKNQSLDVHHINYDKLLSIPENCCALCKRCNCEVNYNRKQWTKFFQAMLSERYDYEYRDENVILNTVENQE